jgi:hypothetical protein
VARHYIEPTPDLAAWREKLRGRLGRQARELGLSVHRAYEVFALTAWGIVPTLDQLERDLPVSFDPAQRARVAARLARWS